MVGIFYPLVGIRLSELPPANGITASSNVGGHNLPPLVEIGFSDLTTDLLRPCFHMYLGFHEFFHEKFLLSWYILIFNCILMYGSKKCSFIIDFNPFRSALFHLRWIVDSSILNVIQFQFQPVVRY